MEETRLPTELVVAAALRDCALRAVPAYVLYKGAAGAGAVVVKIVIRGQGCRLLDQTRDMDGRLVWLGVFDDDVVDEAKADDYIRRARQRDPDLWVVEVEDPSGQNPFALR